MEFKSIAVTGHTSGLGKGVYDHYQSLGYNVKGFSKDNGFDISSKENIDRIVELTRDCDLFFNNAYYQYQQAEIAKLWQQQHWSDQHYIINTSSLAAEPLADIPNNFPWLKEYGEEKYTLNKISWEINHSGSRCKSIIIMPGVCQTNFYNPYDTEENNGLELYNKILETNSIITVEDFVNTIDLLLKNINKRNFISSITLLNAY